MEKEKNISGHKTPAIFIRGLFKSFGDLHVLRGIDLDVFQGENVVVLGRSGTGKSVLIKINAIFKMSLLCSSKSIFYDLGLKKFLRAYILTIRTAFFENCVNFGQNLFKKYDYNCLNASFFKY